MSFITTVNPTPYGFFDAEPVFQSEANSLVVFVKRKLGDDVLSVELTKKEIWTCFEEATCEYSRYIHEMKIQSELANVLGSEPGSAGDMTNKYPHQTLSFLMRQASPYSTYAGVGGVHDATLGYIDIELGRQDYNLYTELKGLETDSVIYDSLQRKSKLRVLEVFHFDPIAAQHYLLNAANVTNFLAQNFNYESYVNSTVFYVLPVFEDVLRRTMLETSYKVRRSHYSFQIIGSNLRIFPIPIRAFNTGRLYVKVFAGQFDPLNPSALQGEDDSVNGISGPENMPYGNLPYSTISEPGKQWIRQYCFALCKELLGLNRSKFKTIPIPNSELTLNGDDLISSAKEEKERLHTQIKEFLENLTNAKLMETQALLAENLNKQLKYIPIPLGKAITMG